MKTTLRTLLAPALLAALAGCGGAHHGPATTLVYTAPADAGQWRLVPNPASTPRHLVLDLLAPAGASGMGVTMELGVDASRARWAAVAGATLVQPGAYVAPLAQSATLLGPDLRILLSQEAPTAPVAYTAAPVLTVALDLVSGAAPGQVAVTVANAGHLAASGTLPVPLSLAIGSVKAQ